MSGTHVTVSGAPEGFDARLILEEVERGDAVVHVARDDKRLVAMQDALRFFTPSMPVLVFPGWDCLPYDCLLYTSPSPRDKRQSRMPSSA